VTGRADYSTLIAGPTFSLISFLLLALAANPLLGLAQPLLWLNWRRAACQAAYDDPSFCGSSLSIWVPCLGRKLEYSLSQLFLACFWRKANAHVKGKSWAHNYYFWESITHTLSFLSLLKSHKHVPMSLLNWRILLTLAFPTRLWTYSPNYS
jgi:hypothetical protein